MQTEDGYATGEDDGKGFEECVLLVVFIIFVERGGDKEEKGGEKTRLEETQRGNEVDLAEKTGLGEGQGYAGEERVMFV